MVFVLAALVSVLHYLGFQYNLYWVFWWYDILVHFLGGALVAVFAVMGVRWYRYDAQIDSRSVWLIGIGAAVAIGITWEIYELAIGLVEVEYIADTTLDLVMDIVGAFAVMFVVRLLSPHPDTITTTQV
jgi:hypothetical protein